MRSLARFPAIVLCVLSLAAPPAAAQQLRLTLDDIEHPAFSAHDIDLRWSGGRASLSIARLRLAGRDLGRVALRCATAVWQRGGFECRGGMLRLGSGETLPLSLVYDAAAGSLELAFADAPLAAVARLVPELAAWKLAGRLDGTLRLAAGRAEARCAIRQASFSDAAGMRAGEALAASASLAGQLDPSGGWRWEARLDWSGGEVYWAPVYLKAEQQALSAAGTYADGIITVTAGEAQLGGLGRAAFTLAWSAATRQLSAARLDVDGIDLARAVPALLQPTLDERALPRLAARGRARLALTLAGDGVSEIDLDLDDVDLAEDDASPRFAINGLTARIPWRRDAETEAELHAAGGSLGRLPLGTIALAPRLNGFALTLAKAEIPLLDGRLILEDVEARRLGADCQWRGGAARQPGHRRLRRLPVGDRPARRRSARPRAAAAGRGGIAPPRPRPAHRDLFLRRHHRLHRRRRARPRTGGLEAAALRRGLPLQSRRLPQAHFPARRPGHLGPRRRRCRGGDRAHLPRLLRFLRLRTPRAVLQAGRRRMRNGWNRNRLARLPDRQGRRRAGPQRHGLQSAGALGRTAGPPAGRDPQPRRCRHPLGDSMRLSLAMPAAALCLSACVTINIYFPAAAAEKAADKIIDEVWQLQQGHEKDGGRNPEPAKGKETK